MKMTYPNIFHYCPQCEKEEIHFNKPSIFTENAFECLTCENTIILSEYEEVKFIEYRD